MRAFKFSLESVLMLRIREEDVAKDSYAEAVAFYNRTMQSLNQGLGDLEQLQETLSEKRQGVSKKDDQLMFLQAIRQQRSFCDTLTQRLARAQQLQDLRFRLWMEARSKTQMLEKLKERHKQRYDAEVQRIEEKAVDDLVSARWGSGRREFEFSF
jgi:flagellar export protein FliJ